ncbi:lactococcin 972 family bacteriocin [Streptomyces sp. NPDC001546]|uniref:lactococcin 972 family bacteriocin n=1 Tax=Streptomyces sp. NPDC001546 TaxID=3364585 RepID=UPI0036D17449
MKISASRIGVTCGAISLFFGGFLAPGAAASTAVESSATAARVAQTVELHKRGDGTKPPAQLGNPTEWGVVKVEMNASGISTLGEACVPASGGNWCYGWYLTGSDATQKRCYSNYYHYSRTHSSSVKIGGTYVNSGQTAPNNTANASWTTGAAYTCYTYYSVD